MKQITFKGRQTVNESTGVATASVLNLRAPGYQGEWSDAQQRDLDASGSVSNFELVSEINM